MNFSDIGSMTFTQHKLSDDWECELFGTGRQVVLIPLDGMEPNWFWRKMQYLCFGNRWVRRR